jgi:hypothetical protein
MSDSEPESKSGLPPKVSWILAIGFLALVGYQVFTGVVFQKIGFGPMSIEFGTPSPRPMTTRQFLVGHWSGSGYLGQMDVEYNQEGTISGWRLSSDKPFGMSGVRSQRWFDGEWDFTPVNDSQFRLTVRLNRGGPQSGAPAEGGDWLLEQFPLEGTFGIRDQNHIRFLGKQDYILERVAK